MFSAGAGRYRTRDVTVGKILPGNIAGGGWRIARRRGRLLLQQFPKIGLALRYPRILTAMRPFMATTPEIKPLQASLTIKIQ